MHYSEILGQFDIKDMKIKELKTTCQMCGQSPLCGSADFLLQLSVFRLAHALSLHTLYRYLWHNWTSKIWKLKS